MKESTEQSKWQTNYLEEVIRESGSRLGYKELKHEQTKAILSFVQGNDTFVALPTGYVNRQPRTSNTPYFSPRDKYPAHVIFNDVISRRHQLNT